MPAIIKAFYIENFKAIRKGRWFDFADISLLTGANSSGKSTIFKAINFFGQLFKTSDFPVVSLDKTIKIGSIIQHLTNDYGGKDEFTLGFRFHSPFFDADFEAYFVFTAYDEDSTIFIQQIRLELNGECLLTMYDSHQIEELIGYAPVLYNYDDPSQITIKLQLEVLEQLFTEELKTKTINLLGYLREKFGNEWMLEAISADVYGPALVHLRFDEELYTNLRNDFYCNLYASEEKLGILTLGDKKKDEAYIQMSKELNYQAFVDYFFKPILKELSDCMRFCCQGNVIHIDFEEILLDRVVHYRSDGDFLPKISEENGRMMLDYSLKNKYNPRIIYEKSKISVHQFRKLDRCDIRENYEHFFEVEDKKRNNISAKNSKLELIYEPEFELLKLIADSMLIFELKNGIVIDKPVNGANIIYILDDKYLKQLADLGRGESRIICMILLISWQLTAATYFNPKKPGNDKMGLIIHIEEPETCLHPKWQSRLADYFVFLTSTYDIQIIIETHSVYLIQRLQLMVAHRQIMPEQIFIRYFERSKKDISVRNISIRPDGMLKGEFGTGFFDESDLLTSALLNQQSPN
jgi:energy-coupling factor transporter ATP-binding protein EcfA2